MANYKTIIKSEKTRYKLLQALNFLPSEIMIPLQYRIKTGRRLNLRDPQRYSEKIQWYKLKYRDPIMKECVDKWEVREYIKRQGFERILNDVYGIYDSPDRIEWGLLPNEFVIKDTLGSGGRSIILVKEKSKLDIQAVSSQMQEWVDTPTNARNYGREWVYEGQKHRIVIEKLLKSNDDGDLPDYKFFCFNGKAYCLYMMDNYTMHHDQGRLGFLNREFTLLDVRRKDFSPMNTQPQKPKNYEMMLTIAEELSKGFPHVRVDLYNINGDIVFGEMTFFNGSGYIEFEPDSFDYEMGKQFLLPINHRN